MKKILHLLLGCSALLLGACSAGNTIEFDITGNYILIPVEDNDPESVVQLSVDGKKIGEPMYIRVSQTKVGYWVPIDVSEYKGRKVTLTFEHLQKTDIGFSQRCNLEQYSRS